MILEKLTLANFRGFEQLDLAFHPKVTVLAGINGVGKSSILHALAVLLSRSVPEFTPAPQPRTPHVFSDDDISYGHSALEASIRFITHDVTLHGFGSRARFDPTRMAELSERLEATRREMRYAKGSRLRDLKHTEKGLVAAQRDQGDVWRLLLMESAPTEDGAPVDSQEIALRRSAVLRKLRTGENPPVAILFTPNRQLSDRPRKATSQAPFEPPSAYLDALGERRTRLGDFMTWFHAMEALPGRGAKWRRRVLR